MGPKGEGGITTKGVSPPPFCLQHMLPLYTGKEACFFIPFLLKVCPLLKRRRPTKKKKRKREGQVLLRPPFLHARVRKGGGGKVQVKPLLSMSEIFLGARSVFFSPPPYMQKTAALCQVSFPAVPSPSSSLF